MDASPDHPYALGRGYGHYGGQSAYGAYGAYGEGGEPPEETTGPEDDGDGRSARRGRRRGSRLIASVIGLTLLSGLALYAVAQGVRCAGGSIPLRILVAPEMAPAVRTTARHFGGAAARVDDRCVRPDIREADSARVANVLSGRATPDTIGGRPDAWIPDTSMWVDLIPPTKAFIRVTAVSLGESPLVIGIPKAATTRPGVRAFVAAPTWSGLLRAVSPAKGAAGGAGDDVIVPSDLTLRVPDPAATGEGVATVVLARTLLGEGPESAAAFTGVARAMRQVVTTAAMPPTSFGRRQIPLGIVSEQAIWKHNRDTPNGPVVALYPAEGTLALDYPFLVTTDATDQTKAAELFGKALSARHDAQTLGFRDPGGRAPASFGNAGSGVRAEQPSIFPRSSSADVRDAEQAWLRLTLSARILSLIDISGSMAEKVPGGLTRLQAIARVSQRGLALQPDDTELGQWVFSTKLVGSRDWRENVSLGPLGERIGSMTRRQALLAALATLHPKPDGNTGLYDSVLAAFRYMMKTYKPQMVNTILLLTDGKNDDDNGPSLAHTLATLKKEYDPYRPVQVLMIGFGPGVDAAELGQIAAVTHGSVYIAHTPADIGKIFLAATARRICAPKCRPTN